ncbi:hypothetical protein K1X13_05385 [Nocardioides sp. WL0053]|uniref:ATP-binding protein n=1 Tax=Nocardioides jiangsuensis TaxID=2866161 RepID=A0ABS7RGT8_9ACTN|nr:hypothetical protein [Nocardioides jiangsuensis]MBY9074251.1 hypothetical protein [Nocardioides jiangsuensis]
MPRDLRPLPNVRFREIREHGGHQDRAWEELAFQLAGDMDQIPHDAVWERRGTPDGGIEFSCAFELGGRRERWAWQAKYLFSLSASAFRQMGDSFKDAIANEPDITRYLLVVPVNRPAGAIGTSALKKWEDYVADWQQHARDRGIEVAIEYRGESEVVQAITLAKNAGTLRYFFDHTFLGHDVCASVVNRAITNLGDRYEPDTDVGSQVDDVLDAVVLNNRFVDRLGRTLRQASEDAGTCASYLRRAGVDSEPIRTAAARFADERDAARLLLQDALAPDFARLERSAADLIDRLEHGLDQARRELTDRVQAPQPGTAPVPSIHEVTDVALRAVDSARRARALCVGDQARAATTGAVLLVGGAGSGKSHTLASHCAARLEEEQPTLLALGQHLAPGSSVWSEVLTSMDFNYDSSDLLQGLESAALVNRSGRALIVVDAVNEGAGRDLWHSRATGFRADIRAHPRVAVILSVRDTYENVVLPDGFADDSDLVTRLVHPGIEGRESLALERYAAHYGLDLPAVPGYHPEFSNPLLLKSVCRSARGHGVTTIPTLDRGQAWIFDGLLNDVDNAICSRDRLDRDPGEHIVVRAVQDLARVMNTSGSEAVPLRQARCICRAIHDDGGRASRSLLNALCSEGILLREKSRDGGEQVRVTFQRLTDYLRAQDLLAQASASDELARALGSRLSGPKAWSWLGVTAALCALVPERFGVELIDLLAPDKKEEGEGAGDGADESAAGDADGRNVAQLEEDRLSPYVRYELATAHLDSLAWRQASSITPRTVEVAREAVLRHDIENDDWVGALLHVSCTPGHPLNAAFMSGELGPRDITTRHFGWYVAVHALWGVDGNPVARLVDWAWNPGRALTEPVRRLVAQQLTWFLGSTSPRLRDSSTKALINVLDAHTGDLVWLLNEFVSIDDWYIVERLHAVTYGHVTRLDATNTDDDALIALAGAVVALHDARPTTHLLIRYYSERALVRIRDLVSRPEDLPELQFAVSGWPLTAPTRKEVALLLGDPNDRYLTGSPMGYDFREKLIKRGVGEEFVPPDQRRLIANRKARARRLRAKTLDSLQQLLGDRDPAEVIEEVKAAEGEPVDITRPARRRSARQAVIDTLPEGAEQHLRTLDQADRSRRSTDPVHMDGELLVRWLIARTLELGWIPEALGGPAEPHRSRLPGEDKLETLGKKHLWTAYYELLGVLTDHCTVHRFGGEAAEYRNPWQLHSADDIDPTIAIRGDTPPPGSTSARLLELERGDGQPWWRTHHASALRTTIPADVEWLNDESDIPAFPDLLSCTDADGERWVVLESHSSWERDKAPSAREPHRHDMWFRTQSYFVRAEHLDEVATWASGKNWMGLWMPTPPDWGPGWFREYPAGDPWSEWLATSNEERRFDGDTDGQAPGWVVPSKESFPSAPIALTTHGSTAKADRDLSATDLPRTLLPSPTTIGLLGARLAPPRHASAGRLGLGPVESEYAWLVGEEIVMFATDGHGHLGGSSLLVKARVLNDALQRAGWACWSWVLGEKINWVNGDPTSTRMDIFGAAAIDTDVRTWSRDTQVKGVRDETHEVIEPAKSKPVFEDDETREAYEAFIRMYSGTPEI